MLSRGLFQRPSQGHGRPCLQRSHPRPGFSATWSLLMVISMLCSLSCALKRFPRTSSWKMVMSWVNPAFLRTRGKRFQGCPKSGRCAFHDIEIRRRDAATLRFWKRWFSMCYKTGRGNVAKKCLRFHATVKMVFDYQPVTAYPVAASRQLAPEVIMVMFVSTLDTPRRGWNLWRFASLIPSGWRLTPIHKARPLKKSSW